MMSLALAAGMVSSVIFAASNLPMLVKARRTRDLSSYSLAYLVMNNVGNLLYCLYVFDLPPGPIWVMQCFYLLSMGLLLRWYLRFRPRRRARRAQPRFSFTDVVADAADPVVAGQLIDADQPRTIVLNVSARPLTGPIHQHTWETVSRNWHVDIQQVVSWSREALLRPLLPGSTVIAFSSGAAVAGSPLSGGYAGAKAIGFIVSYAATESERIELGIKCTAVLPQLTPATDLGDTAYLLTTAGLATAS